MMQKHALFVKLVVKGENSPDDKKQIALTRDILLFIKKHLSNINQMGIQFKVTALKTSILTPNVKAVLKKKGVTRLPMLLTPKGAYGGPAAIKKLYMDNITRLQKAASVPLDDDDSGDAFQRYARGLMSKDRDGDDEESAIGDSAEDLKSKVASAMAQRKKQEEKRPGAGRRVAATADSPPPSSQPQSRRATLPPDDEDAAGPSDEPPAPVRDEAPTTGTGVSHQTLKAAFQRTGDNDGDEMDVGGSSDQDDKMMQAFWDNQEES
jgi:hypothetical protein